MMDLVFFAAGKCVCVDLAPCCLRSYLAVDLAACVEQAPEVGVTGVDLFSLYDRRNVTAEIIALNTRSEATLNVRGPESAGTA